MAEVVGEGVPGSQPPGVQAREEKQALRAGGWREAQREGFPLLKLTRFPDSLEFVLCPAGGKGSGNLTVGQGCEAAESANQLQVTQR